MIVSLFQKVSWEQMPIIRLEHGAGVMWSSAIVIAVHAWSCVVAITISLLGHYIYGAGISSLWLAIRSLDHEPSHAVDYKCDAWTPPCTWASVCRHGTQLYQADAHSINVEIHINRIHVYLLRLDTRKSAAHLAALSTWDNLILNFELCCLKGDFSIVHSISYTNRDNILYLTRFGRSAALRVELHWLYKIPPWRTIF